MPEPSQFMTIHSVGDVTVIRFAAGTVLDFEKAAFLRDRVIWLIENRAPVKLLINLGNPGNVTALSSFAFGILISIAGRIKQTGGGMAICGESPDLPGFPSFPDEDEGLQGITCRLIPPKPSDSGSVALEPPQSEDDES